MTKDEAILYDEILFFLPSERRVFSNEIPSKADHFHVKAILREMEREGIVKVYSETTDSGSGRSLLIGIESAGEVLRANGGYRQRFIDNKEKERIQNKKESQRIFLDHLRTWATVLGVIVAGIAWYDSRNTNKKTNSSIDIFDDRLQTFEDQTERIRSLIDLTGKKTQSVIDSLKKSRTDTLGETD